MKEKDLTDEDCAEGGEGKLERRIVELERVLENVLDLFEPAVGGTCIEVLVDDPDRPEETMVGMLPEDSEEAVNAAADVLYYN